MAENLANSYAPKFKCKGGWEELKEAKYTFVIFYRLFNIWLLLSGCETQAAFSASSGSQTIENAGCGHWETALKWF